MLSRDADSLYWLSRYVERAENTARILDVAYRMASMPISYNGVETNEWESALATACGIDQFRTLYGEITPERVIEFLAFSEENPSSIQCCFNTARQNARSVRS
ncbi:MAG TPA: alpha-E domain-containing protein, partial [Microvirga sp.]|nr:alpha-E domain-containing protein [Microvirga sp.]